MLILRLMMLMMMMMMMMTTITLHFSPFQPSNGGGQPKNFGHVSPRKNLEQISMNPAAPRKIAGLLKAFIRASPPQQKRNHQIVSHLRLDCPDSCPDATPLTIDLGFFFNTSEMETLFQESYVPHPDIAHPFGNPPVCQL